MTKRKNFRKKQICLLVLGVITYSNEALAVTLDWKGYFRADNNYVRNYQMDNGAPGNTNDATADGEYVKGQGAKSATFTTFFAKLKPSVLINDNLILHSEWNIGDPIYGFFGRNVPSYERDNPTSASHDGMSITAARLWMDAHTDFGLVQVGRAPMHWGLGVIFNSGDEPFDRYQSTMDTIRFVSKFGYLSVMPMYAKENTGKSLGGQLDKTSTTVVQGTGEVTDYGVGLKFHNPEDELEAGFLFLVRNAGDQQDAFYYPYSTQVKTQTNGPNGMNLRLLDLYAKKTWYRLTVAGELPSYSGTIGDVNGVSQRNSYKSTGFAGETRLDFDRWHHSLRFGYAPGQTPETTGNRDSQFNAMYFNRNYKLGQVLFRYNLQNFGSNNPDSSAITSPLSPYDAAIVNAKYIMLGTENRGEHWSWSAGFVYAKAAQTAQTGKDYFIHSKRAYGTSTAKKNQSDSLGFEIDLGLAYNWDENIRFGTDFGMFFPGEYYSFNNSAVSQGHHDMVMGLTFNASAKF